MKYDIFISYRREDGAQYARIVQLILENSGFSVFLDYDELRDGNFSNKIENAIKAAPVFIMILTNKYLSRCWRRTDWVRREIAMAISGGKKIIPIVPDSMPVNIPLFLDAGIKSVLKTEQYSHVDFGSRLKDDINAIIRERIEQNVNLTHDEHIPYSYVLDERTYPVNYLEFDKKRGFALTPFTSLIVGFENLGQEIFKFLYEYSSFIAPDGKRTGFKCYAVDENIEANAGSFVGVKMPAIGEDELSLIQSSVNSQAFWNLVKDIIEDLNYIVIAMDNDKDAYSLVSLLFDECERRSKNSKVGIFVKCNNSRARKSLLNLNERSVRTYVHPFVADQNDEDEDRVMTHAKEFNWLYCGEQGFSAEAFWEYSVGEQLIDRLVKCKNMSHYHAAGEQKRKVNQAISCSLHCYTIANLLELSGMNSERLRLFYGYAMSRDCRTIKYPCEYEDAQLLVTMAMMEHERWVASHKLMGYTYAPEIDHIKKHHKCICPWDQLDETMQSYDCDVVDTTIKMVCREFEKMNKQIGHDEIRLIYKL